MDFEAVVTQDEEDLSADALPERRPRRATGCHGLARLVGVALLIVTSQVLVAVAVLNNMMGRHSTNDINSISQNHVQSGLVSRSLVLFGLKEGYGAAGAAHNLTQAQGIIDEWMKVRKAQNQHVISGALRSETLIYPHQDYKDGLVQVNQEEAAVFAGVVYDDNVETEIVLDTLKNLTEALCVPLGQEICFYEYKNVEYIWTNPELSP